MSRWLTRKFPHGISFSAGDAIRANIANLVDRYGKRFNQGDAVYRNLDQRQFGLFFINYDIWRRSERWPTYWAF